MSRYPLIIVTSILFIFSSCIEEPEIVIDPQVGAEVQFGLSLEDGIKTRTVYGEETQTRFPVYWVHGDRVIIASPECLEGRNSARYEVACSTNVQSKADALNKVDAAGVQWGDNESATFYSIYPAIGNDLSVKDGKIDATLTVASTQYAKISQSSSGNTTYAQPADMGNVIMYATASATNGDPVSLQYKPFSTVIEFQTNTPGMAAGEQPLTIQSLTLTAPSTAIAGQFKFTFPQSESGSPSIAPISGTTSNSITIHFTENNEYKFAVSGQQTLKFKMCIMPIAGVSSMEGWKVVLATSAGNKSITLKSRDNNGKSTSLTPGKVHKIVLPQLSYATTDWVYNNSSWITSIPDYEKVYLSELSLPGAWYAVHDNDDSYQNGGTSVNNIANLWKAGVRAFAVETKTIATTRSTAYAGQDAPIGVIISGTGYNSRNDYSGGYKSTVTDENGEMTKGTDGTVYNGGTRLSEVIKAVANQVLNTDEFGVLVLSYADGGNSGNRYVDHGAWLNLLNTEYKNAGVSNVYTGTIDENTTVEQVLGKLIIKINVDKNIAYEGKVGSTTFSFTKDLPALYSYTPFVQQIGDYENLHFSNLYSKEWSDNYRVCPSEFTSTSGFSWCFSSANRTQKDTGTNTEIPNYTQRKGVLEKMLEKSKEIYDKSSHNVWFYFNCGGTEATGTSDDADAEAFAKIMNKWLKETIETKTDPSPLGLVMFNQCTGANSTYYGEDIIKAIVEMNSKFYLKHEGDVDPERPITQFDDSLVGVDNWSTDFIQ